MSWCLFFLFMWLVLPAADEPQKRQAHYVPSTETEDGVAKALARITEYRTGLEAVLKRAEETGETSPDIDLARQKYERMTGKPFSSLKVEGR